MKKDWLLLIASVVITLGIALSVIRWVAPQMLGIASDLQLVQIDKKVPPFFENVFRQQDFSSQSYLIDDPIVRIRAKPFNTGVGFGPNDLLGFRNRAIPNSAKIVVIGDSQTYGNNEVIDNNWPGQMNANLKSKEATVYNMAVGGWAAPQYFNMFTKAMVFQPEVIVIAFYTGNDPLESFMQVYGNPYWQSLIPDKTISATDGPKLVYPPPKEDHWPVSFKDGVTTVFSPKLRLTSNLEHPAIKAGYDIMANVVSIIADLVIKRKVKVFFTIIPTKELVYANKIAAEGMQTPKEYQTLIGQEMSYLEQLAASIQSFPQLSYVDVLKPLQTLAMQAVNLYPTDMNGHPIKTGYGVIGKEIAKAVKSSVSAPRRELVKLEIAPGEFRLLLLKEKSMHFFATLDAVVGNGWNPSELKTWTNDEIVELYLPLKENITEIKPELFGPLKSE